MTSADAGCNHLELSFVWQENKKQSKVMRTFLVLNKPACFFPFFHLFKHHLENFLKWFLD